MPHHAPRRPASLLVAAAACGALAIAPPGARAQTAGAPATPARPAAGDSAGPAVQLDSARAAFRRALNSGSKTSMLATFADSAVVTAPSRASAGEFADFWLQQGTQLTSMQLTTLRIAGPADASESGAYTLANGGTGRYSIEWRRNPSGRWAVRTLTTSD